MRCPNCSKQVSDNSKFCESCGTRIPVLENPIEELVVSGGVIRFGKRKTLPTGAWLFTCVEKDNNQKSNVDPEYRRDSDGQIFEILNPECLALCIGDSFAATNAYYHRMHRYLKKNLDVGDSLLIEGGSDDSVVIMDGMKFKITKSPLNP